MKDFDGNSSSLCNFHVKNSVLISLNVLLLMIIVSYLIKIEKSSLTTRNRLVAQAVGALQFYPYVQMLAHDISL